MMGRDDRIYDEAAALWRRLYDEPPPTQADGKAILALIVGRLGEANYQRLANPYLRPSNIAFPKEG
jgi:hypothetical protein